MKFTSVAGAFAVAAGLSCMSAEALVGPADEGARFAAHTVMVLKRGTSGASYCTGIVIAADVVLTAGHCVASAGDTRVHFRDGEGQPVFRSISAIAIHPLYRANAVKTRERSIDLALLRLSEKLPERFRPVTFDPAQAVSLGARFRIAGFGVAREGRGETSGVLRSGLLVARAPLSAILLWAEDPQQKGLGACQGDSGGPIFSEPAGALVAVTSWAEGASGRGCGKLTQAALIAPQRGWIEDVLQSWRAK